MTVPEPVLTFSQSNDRESDDEDEEEIIMLEEGNMKCCLGRAVRKCFR